MESFESLCLTLLTGIVGITLLLRRFATWKSVRWYRGIPHRWSADISHLNTPLPDALRPDISELQRLGFHRLGESQLRDSEQAPLGMTWLLVNAERTIFVQVVALGHMRLCGFTTTFADGAVTEVGYPEGEHIDDPDFVHHRNSVSIEDACRQRLDQVEAMCGLHGAPRSIQTMQDCLDVLACNRYTKRVLKVALRTKAFVPLAINLVIAVLLAGLLIGQHISHLAPSLILGATVVIALIYFKWALPVPEFGRK